jgi:outer membrane protein assembly factor BamB
MSGPVTTRSYDLARSGANDGETVLSATAVRTRGIVKLFSMAIADDPRLEAQPLAVGGVRTAHGPIHDMIFQASMGNTVYAFDAQTGAELWKTNLGRPIAGSKQIDAWLVNISWGILSTPVIDEAAGILYACAWISPDGTAAKGQHVLAALRLSDGSLVHPMLNLEGAVYAPPGLPQQKFASAQRKQRAALTLTRGHVLIPFGTIAESASTARGWLIAVDVGAWRIAATWCSTVTGAGGGIWQSGAGPAVSADGSIFVVTGNGAFGPDQGDYSESVVKLTLRTEGAAGLEVASWWAPWTDAQRAGGEAVQDDKVALATPSNVSKTRLFGHARRLSRTGRFAFAPLHHVDTDNVFTGTDPFDRQTAAQLQEHVELMSDSEWDDQDFGSGGPVYAADAAVILAAGKDGILYTGDARMLGNPQPASLSPTGAAANYAKLRSPPILYTYYDATMQPAPQVPTALNKRPGGATRHLHGTPLLWHSAVHGLMHFVGGENSALRAWTLAPDGSSTYQAGSNEVASPQAPRPPGGMPGWSITLAANNGADGIIVAMIPYRDSNMAVSAGRFLIYDAQTFATNADGSQRLQVLWDSEQWGPEHAFSHPKFNRPIVWQGRIYRPTYDGRIDVYGLPP